MSKQEVIICHNLEENLNKAINQCPHDKLFVLADEHTRELCIPVLSEFDCIKNAHFIYIWAQFLAGKRIAIRFSDHYKYE